MRKLKGFTLIELLVVVAIIGILATVIVVNLANSQNRAKDAKVQAEVSQISNAAEVLKTINGGKLPATLVATTRAALTDTLIALFKDGTTQILPSGMKGPDGTSYNWVTNSGGTAYLVDGTLSAASGSWFECYTGKVCDTVTVEPTVAK